MRIEIVAPAAAPDPDIADVAVTHVTVGIDAPMQSVAGKKIVEELGPHQLALRHDLRHQRRFPPGLQLEGDGVVILVVDVVVRKVLRGHVQEHGLFEALRRVPPDKRCVIIGLQQFQQVVPDCFAHVTFAHIFRQQSEDARQYPAL